MMFHSRQIDENGKLLPSDEWETTGQMTGIELSKEANENINDSNFLRYSGLDDGEFYCMFIVFDINNNAHSYDLVKVGE